jgi:hypothetical protein
MSECIHTNSNVSADSLERPAVWGGWLKAVLIASTEVIFDAQRRARERHQLASMDERMWRDMGLTRADVQFELDKWFWEG